MSNRDQQPGLSRRGLLQAGAATAAAWTVLGGQTGASYATGGKRGPAARTLPFATDWLFGGPATPGSTRPGFDDSRFDDVTLPHTVTPLSWREWDPETWQQVWIYRRHFDIPRDLAGLRLFLDFEAATTAATLTLNGSRLGEHVGGYLPFSFEVTDRVESTGNVLAVELDSRFNINVPPNRPGADPRSVDFWQPGGLYRQATLRAVPEVFVADVFAKPVAVLTDRRRLEAECTVDVGTATSGRAEVTVELLDDGERVASTTTPVDVSRAGETTARLTLHGLPDVELWDVDDPRLYDVVTTLSIDGRPVHDYATRVGFREAEFTKQGFFLNGRRVQIFGVNRHQLYPFAGYAMPPRIQRKDAEIVRRTLRCNMVRAAHYPEADAFFDACDELGLMAWEEVPGWGRYIGDEQWQDRMIRDVGQMVKGHRNHPSIVIWGARANETNDDVELWTTARDLAHSLDDSRPTTGAMHYPLYDTTEFVQDVFSFNDYTSRDGHAALLPPRTDRPYLVSEAVGAISGPNPFYRRDDDPVEIQQGQALAHAHVHNIAGSDERYCGVLAWLGIDYFAGGFNHHRGVKYNGVVDVFREPKLGAAIYQSQVDPGVEAVIAPAFYWDFGPKGLPMGEPAMICSNCERLEVFVGGEHLATVHPDTKRFGNLPYPPSFVDLDGVDAGSRPDLRIDGYVGGERVASRRLASDRSGDELVVTVDDERLVADGADTTRVAFRVLDRYGAPRQYVGDVAQEVTFEVDGPGDLLGDNPFAFADTGGVGAVWLRTVYGASGRTTVTVSHPTLGSRQVTVRSKRPQGAHPRPDVDLALRSSRRVAEPGETLAVTTSLTTVGAPPLRDVELSLATPRGWSADATGPTHFAHVAPGQSVRTDWEVTPSQDASPGTATVTGHATYDAGGRSGAERASATFVVPAPAVPLGETFDNAGISDDSDVDEADLDGVGNSYSQQALTAASLAPGATVSQGGLTFTWPDVASGALSNVVASGETVAVPGSGDTLGFLGASTGGSSSAAGVVYYTDGTISEFTVRLDDYFFPPGAENEIVAEMPYLNSQGVGGRPRGRRDHTVYVFYASAPIDAGKQVEAVRLPETAGAPGGRITGMHVFALAVGDSQ